MTPPSSARAKRGEERAPNTDAAELVVLHSSAIWLPRTQTWLHSQVQDLQRIGVRAHVVCERTENLDQFPVDDIHCLQETGRVTYLWARTLRKLGLRRHLAFMERIGRQIRPHVVHSHFGNSGWADRGAVRALGARHVVTFYGYDVNQLPTRDPTWRARYRELFAGVDRVLCEGTHMARCIVALGCPETRVRVHHLGVAVDEIPFVPRRWVSGEPLRVLIAGSFIEKKGIPYAIEALGLLKRDVPVALTLIGDARNDAGSQGEKRRILEALERTGLRSTCRLLGYQPHAALHREAYAHHVFLHPSVTAQDGDTEGGAPVSITEMLAAGMPVVSTRHCDIPELVGPELERWLAPERDPGALAGILRRLLAQASDWHHFAALGRERVAREYDRRFQATRLLAHYKEILAMPLLLPDSHVLDHQF